MFLGSLRDRAPKPPISSACPPCMSFPVNLPVSDSPHPALYLLAPVGAQPCSSVSAADAVLLLPGLLRCRISLRYPLTLFSCEWFWFCRVSWQTTNLSALSSEK